MLISKYNQRTANVEPSHRDLRHQREDKPELNKDLKLNRNLKKHKVYKIDDILSSFLAIKYTAKISLIEPNRQESIWQY